jgi:Fe-S-cluster containining protein
MQTVGMASHRDELDAGPFSAWLDRMLGVIEGEGTSDVPCGSCTACCTWAQSVPIAPDEVDTLAHLPAGAAVPASMRPAGHMVLRSDERGHCPMLVDGRCSIYDHRPRACRNYDCRVFAATGVDPGGDNPELQRQVARWKFTLDTESDRRDYEAAQGAGTRIEPNPNPLHAAVEALIAGSRHLRSG